MSVEHIMLGGVYWEGDNKLGDRTDISLVECGTGEDGNPFTFQLTITTGSGTYSLCSITRHDVMCIGKFLTTIAREDRRTGNHD